jgi:hypothetical protein
LTLKQPVVTIKLQPALLYRTLAPHAARIGGRNEHCTPMQ